MRLQSIVLWKGQQSKTQNREHHDQIGSGACQLKVPVSGQGAQGRQALRLIAERSRMFLIRSHVLVVRSHVLVVAREVGLPWTEVQELGRMLHIVEGSCRSC
jgi:hypothetical protein